MHVRKKAVGGLLAIAAFVMTLPAGGAGGTELAEPASESMLAGERTRDHRDLNGWSQRVQYEGGWYRQRGRRETMLSPPEVRRILRAGGFRQIEYLDRRGRIYQVQATDRRGQRVGLVVSARNGAILTTYRLN